MEALGLRALIGLAVEAAALRGVRSRRRHQLPVKAIDSSGLKHVLVQGRKAVIASGASSFRYSKRGRLLISYLTHVASTIALWRTVTPRPS